MKMKILLAALVLVVIAGGAAAYLLWLGPQQKVREEEALLARMEATMMASQGMMADQAMGGGQMMRRGQGMMGGQGAAANQETAVSHEWTPEETEMLRSLWIGSLPPLPPDPSNRYADDPQAAALGHKLFFDARLSSNGQVACSTCHIPDLMFNDGRALGIGVGVADRKTMTVIGTAYSAWLFWDGRADSQWAQALGPLENPVEHGGNRSMYVHLVDRYYQKEYEAVFGPLPDLSDKNRFPENAGPVADPEARAAWEGMRPEDRDAVNRVFANIGKAIAAYERKIVPGPSRFDAYVEALVDADLEGMQNALTAEEVAGLRHFIGDAGCIKCHNGPLFTSDEFHNTGVPPRTDSAPDAGRQPAVQKVLDDTFNCLGQYSDADPKDCVQLQQLSERTNEAAIAGAFKPPTLRNVAEMAPYMHAGQYTDLFMVVRHYRHPPEAAVGNSELTPLPFMHDGMMQLLAFLNALSGPLDVPPELLKAPDYTTNR